jgi:dTDP-4-dehydrorhamnose 3,5-epimerase
MKQILTHINDCFVFEPEVHHDDRGFFTELYKKSHLENFRIKQSNCSFSKKGVLRGVHKTPYAKLVSCIKGKIYDVCIDLRPNSITYKDYFGIELSGQNIQLLYIPPYCGHGFLALEDSIVMYYQDQEYNAALDENYCYKDYNIPWPECPTILSHKDKQVCRSSNIAYEV